MQERDIVSDILEDQPSMYIPFNQSERAEKRHGRIGLREREQVHWEWGWMALIKLIYGRRLPQHLLPVTEHS